MENTFMDRPIPDYYHLKYWCDGDDYKAISEPIYKEEKMWKKHEELTGYDNIQIIEVFFHVSGAMGKEACSGVDTRELIYEI